ncbi:uncharacterized protein LOC124943204 [Impatiens glandulifera]|uniref:uncharacterized protein LOC124943204 n=1 Tax=Impatiens glandulifera TaxID=253017 RepID=UPI001FB10C63|nr:uncharacterized protein LOC124943204 [Impatiens glandulifera]
MHLWPSTRIRESFKLQYLKNLEWNLNRMNSQKNIDQQQQKSPSNFSNQQRLLEEEDTAGTNSTDHEVSQLSKSTGRYALYFFRDLFMILSCCYCCFCCGACVDEEG